VLYTDLREVVTPNVQHRWPALLYKVHLLKRFIFHPSFPKDIEDGMGGILIAGLRSFIASELPDSVLIVPISDKDKNRVINSVKSFFENVPEFFIQA
jgi:hypothetical protein